MTEEVNNKIDPLDFLTKKSSEAEQQVNEVQHTLNSFGDQSMKGAKGLETGESARIGYSSQDVVRAEFYTDIGTSLYKGQPLVREGEKVVSSFRMGLTKFDKYLGEVMQAARQNDPFADQLLLDISNQMLIAENVIDTCEDHVNKIKNEKTSMIGVYCEIKAPKITNIFNVFLRTPIANKFFWDIKRADSLSLINLFCRRRQIIDREQSRQISIVMSREINKLYAMVRRFHYSGVTRQDILNKNQRAIQAITLNPKIELTEGIMDLSTRSIYAPAIIPVAETFNAQTEPEKAIPDFENEGLITESEIINEGLEVIGINTLIETQEAV